MSSRRPKRSRPSQRHLLPWGYDAPRPDNLSLDEFIEIITKKDEEHPYPSSEVKNVLIYWDRGTLERGDEAKLQEMNFDSNRLYAHVLDPQEWFQVRFPKGRNGKEKHNLGEAAEMMGVEMTTQDDLDKMVDTEREYKLGSMRHNGAGDSDLTVRVIAELIRRRIAELEAQDGRLRQISHRYCFSGLDFEGGGHIGQGTTEIGLTKLWASDIQELGQAYWSAISNRHAVILENVDDHIPREAQNGKISIYDRCQETYPRWNFRGGPNTTEKCKYIFQETRTSTPKVFNISIDSEIISHHNMAWWILHQVPRANSRIRNTSDTRVTHVELPPLISNPRYPTVVIVDSENEHTAARLSQLQVRSTYLRHHRAKRPVPHVEEDWCM